MTCPNCGRNLTSDYCPNCGWTMPSGPNRAGAVLVLIFLAMPCALMGGCNVVVALSDLSDAHNVGLSVVFGVPTILLTVAFSIWAQKLWRG